MPEHNDQLINAPDSELGKPHVLVEVLSQPRYLSGARALVTAVAKRLGFDETACGQIALAVDEALCNVIRHGYDRRPDGLIWLSIWPIPTEAADEDAQGILIRIDDLAKQVDPQQIKSRALDDIRPGGLGVHTIKEDMDEAVYAQRDGQGMTLTMRKLHTPEAGGRPAARDAPTSATRSSQKS